MPKDTNAGVDPAGGSGHLLLAKGAHDVYRGRCAPRPELLTLADGVEAASSKAVTTQFEPALLQ
jgi:hypothetical protein